MLDRFTRDEVSAKVWWPLALLALIALVLTFPAANRAADRARAEKAAEAATLSRTVIEPLTVRGATPLELSAALVGPAHADPVWSTARVWDADHNLIASSRSEPLNTAAALNDDALQAAFDDGSDQVVTDRTASGDLGSTTFHAYTKVVGSTGADVVEFEARDAVLLAEVHHDWLLYRGIAVLATLLLLGLALLSTREPIARIGAHVPFYPESVPPGKVVIGVDRAVEIQQSDGRVKDRIEAMQQRLDESERLRLKAEGQLQQALTAIGSGGRTMPIPRPEQPKVPPQVRPAASAPSAPPTPAPVSPAPPTPPAAQPAATTPEPRKRTAKQRKAPAPATKSAAAASAPPPTAATVPTPVKRPAPEPSGGGNHAKPAPAPGQAAASEPKAPVRPPEPAATRPAPPEPVTVAADDLAVTATPHGPDSDDDVLDVLHRLVPEGEEPQPLDDPGDLRARLARTAALKKPGSRERQEERDAKE